jgi:hypothetical protein
MSKLSKFKYGISPIEAAKLLSRLIGEDVSIEELQQMYDYGWITIRCDCSATLVKLNPLPDREPPADQHIAGPWLMEAEKDCGEFYGFDLPLDSVEVDRQGLAYVLMDEDGNHYALRDNSTGSYINEKHDSHPSFNESWLDPEEIYELAELANSDSLVTPPKLRIIKQDNCISDVTVYNFLPGKNGPANQRLVTSKNHPQEPQSYALVVAALVELATSDDVKKRNQSSLAQEIEDRFGLRGLSKSNVEKMFSQANRKLTEAKAAKA